MVQSNDNPGNGNGQQEYNPEVEFEYLAADVFIKRDAQGNEDVTYSKDVIEAIEEDSQESDSNGDND